MKNTFIYLLLLICTISCGYKADSQREDIEDVCKVISITDFGDKSVSLSRIYDHIEYVPLESKPKALIGDIKKIIIYNDTIIIKVENSNSNSHVFSFDIKGNFINSLGKLGKGPGEYINPMDILVESSSSTVEILDAALMKNIRYDFKGNLLGETRIDFLGSPINVIKNSDSSYFYYMSNNTVDEKNKYNLYLVNSKGEIMDKFLPIPDQFENLLLISPNNLLNSPSGKFVVPSPSFTIYELSNKSIRERFCFDFGELSMPMEGLKLETVKEKTDFLNNNKYITGLRNFHISNKILFFTVVYNKEFVYFWYDLDKDTFLTYQYNRDPGIDDVLINYPDPLTVYENSLISWQSPHQMNLKSLNDVLGFYGENKITDNSNPVLIFSRLKANIDDE